MLYLPLLALGFPFAVDDEIHSLHFGIGTTPCKCFFGNLLFVN